MKATVSILACAAAFAIATPAAAAATGGGGASLVPGTAPTALAASTHTCTPTESSFTSLTATVTVPCREARALNRFMLRHESLDRPFVLHGHRWRGRVYSRANDQTFMLYRDGAKKIWLTYGGEAS